MEVNYHIDGVNIATYGIRVSKSIGITGRPKLKTPLTTKWETYHGEVVDLENKYYEPREIQLDCFMECESNEEFIRKSVEFSRIFDAKGTRRLSVSVDSSEPLLFEVYLSNGIEFDKKWTDSILVSTFSLKLVEPEPIKRVYKYVRSSSENDTVEIDISTDKMVNIYWGDTTHTFDVCNQLTNYLSWNIVSTLSAFEFKVGQIFVERGAGPDGAWEMWYECIKDYNYNPYTDPIDIEDTEYFTRIYPGKRTHYYPNNGTFYIVITGDVDSINSITTNAKLVWNKL